MKNTHIFLAICRLQREIKVSKSVVFLPACRSLIHPESICRVPFSYGRRVIPFSSQTEPKSFLSFPPSPLSLSPTPRKAAETPSPPSFPLLPLFPKQGQVGSFELEKSNFPLPFSPPPSGQGEKAIRVSLPPLTPLVRTVLAGDTFFKRVLYNKAMETYCLCSIFCYRSARKTPSIKSFLMWQP